MLINIHFTNLKKGLMKVIHSPFFGYVSSVD